MLKEIHCTGDYCSLMAIDTMSNPMKRIGAAILVASLPGLAFGDEINLAEQVGEGGAAVVVILGLSILFLAVTIERAMHLRVRAVLPPDLVARVQPLWAARRFDELGK